MSSPSELVELLRPYQDFEYYAPRCLRILTKSGDTMPFVMNTAQKYVHNRIEQQKREIGKVRALAVKGRQQGVSTYVEARYYHRTSMQHGKQAVILTHQQDSTDKLFSMVRRYHDNCPNVLKQQTSAASAKELHFDALDSGYSVATAGSKAVGRGWTAQYFHGSEIAFWMNAEEHFAGIGQAVPDMPGTEIILESTGNGVGNLFHSMCMDALKGKGEYILIFVPWFWQEEYRKKLPAGFDMTLEEIEYMELYGLSPDQMAWRRAKVQDDFRGNVSLFDQEYPATVAHAFRRMTGDPLIKPEFVTRARGAQGVEARGAKLMGVDVAEYGNDDSAIAYRQGRAVSKIERFHGKGTMELVGIVANRADQYKPDAIMVDCTGVGTGVADRLLELGYPVQRIHFGGKALESEIYGIRRDEMWGEMAKWFEDEPNSIPDDDSLEIDLTAPQYSYDSSRRLKLESKEAMKKRGIPSPDGGDALALTFAYKVSVESAPPVQRKYNWRVG